MDKTKTHTVTIEFGLVNFHDLLHCHGTDPFGLQVPVAV
jgi:hypothetical protein